MSTLLLDDHRILRVLLGDEPASLRPVGAALAAARYLASDICLAGVDDNAPLRVPANEFDVRVLTIRD